jgi:hypothetical protein
MKLLLNNWVYRDVLQKMFIWKMADANSLEILEFALKSNKVDLTLPLGT